MQPRKQMVFAEHFVGSCQHLARGQYYSLRSIENLYIFLSATEWEKKIVWRTEAFMSSSFVVD